MSELCAGCAMEQMNEREWDECGDSYGHRVELTHALFAALNLSNWYLAGCLLDGSNGVGRPAGNKLGCCASKIWPAKILCAVWEFAGETDDGQCRR